MVVVAPTSGRARPVTDERADERGDERADERLADLAVTALVAEATLTPKPGLVDLRGGGAHRDMDVETMLVSARALRPAFVRLAAAGREADVTTAAGLAALRTRLAAVGRDGERDMLRATGGVNTHRGAVWALGLAVGAAASLRAGGRLTTAAAVLHRVAAVAAHDDARPDPASAHLPGARVRTLYEVPGAVGAARAGFPHARAALTALRRVRAAGAPETAARLDALLTSVATLDDTCVLRRGGRDGLADAQAGARRVLAAGGTGTPAGAAALEALDARLVAARLSPGGSADMLALALLLDAVEDLPDSRPSTLRKDS